MTFREEMNEKGEGLVDKACQYDDYTIKREFYEEARECFWQANNYRRAEDCTSNINYCRGKEEELDAESSCYSTSKSRLYENAANYYSKAGALNDSSRCKNLSYYYLGVEAWEFAESSYDFQTKIEFYKKAKSFFDQAGSYSEARECSDQIEMLMD